MFFSARTTLLTLASILSVSASAQLNDLQLPGERWLSTFDKYICSEDGTAVARPAALDQFDVKFETATTDITLDNVLLKATFSENGAVCRYNAILLANNANRTAVLLQSVAFYPQGDGAAYSKCLAGKALLDESFRSTSYLYYGKPHKVAFMIPVVGAEVVCGTKATAVGVNFPVTGKIQ